MTKSVKTPLHYSFLFIMGIFFWYTILIDHFNKFVWFIIPWIVLMLLYSLWSSGKEYSRWRIFWSYTIAFIVIVIFKTQIMEMVLLG
jgi:hypothetical protein